MGKSILIFVFCIPLAILMGIMLSDPMAKNSMLMVGASFALLLSPIFIKGHHAFVVIAANAYINVFFLPGQPQLWVLANGISFFMAILSRPLDRSHSRPRGSRSVTLSLLMLVVVILVTVKANGGIGIRAFGSSVYGGKRYVWLLMAVAGYFALVAQPIARKIRSRLVGLHFLCGLTSIVGNIAYTLGPSFYFLFLLFPVEWALQQAGADQVVGGNALTRISGMGPAAGAIQSWLLVRYGIQGLFEARYPWRAGLFLLSIVGAMFSGFRSSMVTLLLLLAFQFHFERLLRTRLFPIVLAGIVAALAVVMMTAERLPMSLQRTLTFLPIQVDPMVRRDAEGTIEWRVQMWKLLVKEIPQYFWVGKGYALDPTDMYLAAEAAKRGHLESFEGAKLAGDYHSGPLSLIIPLGIFGVIAFVWFLIAGFKVLQRNYLYGDPELQRFNTFLISCFMARMAFFILFFGGFASDFWSFTSLVGLSISLNNGVSKPRPAPRREEQSQEEPSLAMAGA